MSQLTDYKVKVLKSIAVRDGKAIYNGSVEHAAVLTECAFLTATNTISILTNKLDKEAYGRPEVISAAASFLDNSEHKLKVLIESPESMSDSENDFLVAFESYQNVEIKYVPKDVVSKYDYNFYVMDNDSYRLEENRNKPEAVASFGGDTTAAKQLKLIFDTIWQRSEASTRH